MTDLSEKLSAYLDGELDPATTEEIEARLASDPAAQAELDALMDADVYAQEAFEAELHAPVPADLVERIRATPVTMPTPAPANLSTPPRSGLIAAGLVVFALGGLGGYLLNQQATPVQTAGWLSDIADYHAVYAEQVRHLVEVGADEADHIETWLGTTIGTDFTIPDLTTYGLTFEGGRLLVANGKPVAQLMYRDADGAVIALCLQQSSKPPSDAPVFNEQTINGFDFVSWTADGADHVVIGPPNRADLTDIAQAAAIEI